MLIQHPTSASYGHDTAELLNVNVPYCIMLIHPPPPPPGRCPGVPRSCEADALSQCSLRGLHCTLTIPHTPYHNTRILSCHSPFIELLPLPLPSPPPCPPIQRRVMPSLGKNMSYPFICLYSTFLLPANPSLLPASSFIYQTLFFPRLHFFSFLP